MKKQAINTHTFKRVAAGALSVLTVAAYSMPVNVGGFLTGGNALVAYADDVISYYFEDLAADDELVIIDVNNDVYTPLTDGDTWTVIAAPGTVKIDDQGNANTESITFDDVVSIDINGIQYKDPDSNLEDPSILTAEFVDSEKRDHIDNGVGIYVEAIDSENKTLTLSSISNTKTENLSINFNTEGVRDAVKSIKIDTYEYNLPNFSGVLDNLNTGDEIVITSEKALNFQNNNDNDVRFSYDYTANAEAETKYTYTVTVGRNSINAEIRSISASYALAEGETVAPEYDIAEIVYTAIGDKLDDNDPLYPDNKYVVCTSENNLTVYEDINGNGEVDEEDVQIPYEKSQAAEEADFDYGYSFTAPYNNVLVTRSAPHSHEWEWALSETSDKLTATCSKNGEENSHANSISYNYGINILVDGAAVGQVPFGSDYTVAFEPAVTDINDYAEQTAVLNDKFGEVVLRYIVNGELTDEQPTALGEYDVVADLYIPDENGAYSTDGEGDFRVIKKFKITASEAQLAIDVDGDYYEKNAADEYIAEDCDEYGWFAPDVTVKNGDTVLTLGTDYILEGDLTAKKAGSYEVVVVGIGNYEGFIGTLPWYAPYDMGYEFYCDGTYYYNEPFNFRIDGFDGDKNKLTYKAVPYLEDSLYNDWIACTTQEEKNTFIENYEAEFGTDFVEPTKPEPIILGEINTIDIRLPEGVSATEYGNYYDDDYNDVFDNDDDDYARFVALNKYKIMAYYEDKLIAEAETVFEPAETYIGLINNNNNNDFIYGYNGFVYDGLDHSDDVSLVLDNYYEFMLISSIDALPEKYRQIYENIESINSKLSAIKLTPREGEFINVNDDEPYVFAVDYDVINEILGNNFYIDVDDLEYNEENNKLEFVRYAYIEPATLNNGATASAAETVFVETNKYQKPAITVKNEKGEVLESGKDYTLAGTVSAKKGGNYTTRIVGIGNYEGVLSVDWSILDQADFAAAVEVNWNAPVPMLLTDGRTAIKASFTRSSTDASEGYEVIDYGYIYANGEGCNDLAENDLTIDNVDGTAIKQKSTNGTAFNGTYTLTLVDKGYGVAARGYVTLKNNVTGGTSTIYTSLGWDNYENLVDQQMMNAVTITEDTLPTALIQSGKNIIQVKFARTMDENAEGLTVVDYGYIYSNTGCPEQDDYDDEADYNKALDAWNNMNMEDVDGTVVKQNKTKSASGNNGTYTLKLVDNGNGVRYRPYVVIQNAEGAKFTKYGEISTSIFEDLSVTQANCLVNVNNEITDAAVLGNNYTAAKFKTTRSLGDNVADTDVTVLEYGFIYANELENELNEEEFIVGAEGVKKNTKTGNSLAANGTYSLTIKYNDGNPIQTRGYVQIKDNKTGIVRYVYSNIMTAYNVPM